MEIYKLQTQYSTTKDEYYLGQLYNQSIKLEGRIIDKMGCSLPQHTIDDMKADIASSTILKIRDGKIIENFYSYYKKCLINKIIKIRESQHHYKDTLIENIPIENTDEEIINSVTTIMLIIERYIEGEDQCLQIRVIERLIGLVGRKKTANTYFYWMNKKEKQLLAFILNEIKKVLNGK